MKLTTVVFGLAAFAASVSSADTAAAQPQFLDTTSPEVHIETFADGVPKDLIPLAPRSLEKREDTGVFFCVDINFTGPCFRLVAPIGRCVNLARNLNNRATSVGPDSRFCTFYDNRDCNANSGRFGARNPGFKDLTVLGFNDKISSYRCS